MTYYEIDPVVAEVASDPRFFTFLSGAAYPAVHRPRRRAALAPDRARWPVRRPVHRRLLVGRGPDAPPHDRGVRDIRPRVKPGGLVVTHIPNRYYDLAPAVAAALQANELAGAIRVFAGDKVAEATPTILTVGGARDRGPRAAPRRRLAAHEADRTADDRRLHGRPAVPAPPVVNDEADPGSFVARFGRIVWILVPAWFVIVSAIRLSSLLPTTPGYDGMLYRDATLRWLAGGDPWALRTGDAVFGAPPPTLLAMLPFAILPDVAGPDRARRARDRRVRVGHPPAAAAALVAGLPAPRRWPVHRQPARLRRPAARRRGRTRSRSS